MYVFQAFFEGLDSLGIGPTANLDGDQNLAVFLKSENQVSLGYAETTTSQLCLYLSLLSFLCLTVKQINLTQSLFNNFHGRALLFEPIP